MMHTPSPSRTFNFFHVDVFARRPLEGNQLAVFPNADRLGAEEMQTIAREMRLSETTFVFQNDPSTKNKSGVRTRIFTVREELPFAGHPTLGTAWVLKKLQGIQDNPVILELNIGAVPVNFSEEGSTLYGEMTQPDPKFGQIHKRELVEEALGIHSSDLDPDGPIETVSTGVPFTIVPFRSLEILRALQPDGSRMEKYLSTTDSRNFYLISRETIDKDAFLHARMIFYGGEDPATGSAAGTAAAWMVRHAWTRPEQKVIIEQGIEISRPSQIFVTAGGDKQDPKRIRVGGSCFEAIRGELTLS